MKPGAVKAKSGVKAALAAIRRLTRDEVLVGIPKETAPRKGDKVNSAMLLYVHEHGSPARNIPARPVLGPTVKQHRDKAIARLKAGAKLALRGDPGAADKAMAGVGLLLQQEAQRRIQGGIPPPLADSTLRARARRKAGRGVGIRKGAKAELASRAAGNEPGIEFATPLIDTGAMWQAIKYVIRRRT